MGGSITGAEVLHVSVLKILGDTFAMKRITTLLVLSILLLTSISLLGAQDMTYTEAPMLAEMVAAGTLPPLEERLPAEPLVVEPNERIGVYGGTWRMGLRGGEDGALLTRTIGYENLLRWTPAWDGIIPNVASAFEANDEGTEFTFHLREGMKWSDGEPFTAHDIVFWYEAKVANPEVSPSPITWMITNGEMGVVEAVDDYTVKFTFSGPNGLFIQRMAAIDGREVTRYPEHYLAQFHKEYNAEGIDALVAEAGVADWVALWNLKSTDIEGFRSMKPVIGAWVVQSDYTADTVQLVATRNPYYWKVDPEGNQYPYIDTVQYDVGADVETLTLKALNGEIDFQDRHIATNTNKAVFFDNQEAGGYHFYETVPSSMNSVIISLNLTHLDPVKREVFQNKDVRIAMSHAIDRQTIIDLIFVGQGEPWQLAPRPTSPFYNEQLAKQYTEFNVDLANQMLDDAGFAERNDAGIRLGPDGNPISFTIDVAAVNTDQVNVTEQVATYWQAVGIDAQPNVIDRDLLYQRKEANQQDASVWGGDGGLDVVLEPRWYFPFSNESHFGEAWQYWFANPEDPRAEEPPAATMQQMDLYRQIMASADPAQQDELMKQILQIAADEFYAFGINLPANGYGIQKNNFYNVPASMANAWLYPNPAPTNPFQYFIEG
jgi:peptide/nickel transport system substrate-binding protein